MSGMPQHQAFDFRGQQNKLLNINEGNNKRTKSWDKDKPKNAKKETKENEFQSYKDIVKNVIKLSEQKIINEVQGCVNIEMEEEGFIDKV